MIPSPNFHLDGGFATRQVKTKVISSSCCSNALGTPLVYVTGSTWSTLDFPVKSQTGSFFQQQHNSGSDCFVAQFLNTGRQIYSMYYGNNGEDICTSSATDESGDNLILTGWCVPATTTPYFPFADPTPLLQPGNPYKSYYFDGPVSLPSVQSFIVNMKEVCTTCVREAQEDGDDTDEEIKQLLVYPNPSNSYINIAIDEIKQISILNTMGVVVKTSGKKEKLIYVGDLSPGLYLIRVTDDFGKMQTTKFIAE